MGEAAEAASTSPPIIAQVVGEATASDANRFPVAMASFVSTIDVPWPHAVLYEADTKAFGPRKRRKRPETPVVRSTPGGVEAMSVSSIMPSAVHPSSLPAMGTIGSHI